MLHLLISDQKNSKPDHITAGQDRFNTRPVRAQRKEAGVELPHTIYRRQENMIEMQVEVMSDIARTFNQCVCGVPPTPQKGMTSVLHVCIYCHTLLYVVTLVILHIHVWHICSNYCHVVLLINLEYIGTTLCILVLCL